MKYAIVNGTKLNIRDADRGTLGYDCWYREYRVKACKGHYMQYWKYEDGKPNLPEGYENETEWHEAWKSLVYDENCEVICGEHNEHRADIITKRNVIEIQYSSISFEAVQERVHFYSKLMNERVIWIVNAYAAWKNIETILEQSKRLIIKWKYPKRWVIDICGWKDTTVYLDVSPKGKNLLQIWRYQGFLYGLWKKKHDFYVDNLLPVSESIDDFTSIFSHLDIRDYV